VRLRLFDAMTGGKWCRLGKKRDDCDNIVCASAAWTSSCRLIPGPPLPVEKGVAPLASWTQTRELRRLRPERTDVHATTASHPGASSPPPADPWTACATASKQPIKHRNKLLTRRRLTCLAPGSPSHQPQPRRGAVEQAPPVLVQPRSPAAVDLSLARAR
jgi:hypothetical protein